MIITNLCQIDFNKVIFRILSLLKKTKQLLWCYLIGITFKFIKLNQIPFQVIIQNKNQFHYLSEQVTNNIKLVEGIQSFIEYKISQT